jgi:Tol biopolymer transport system component
VTRVSRALGLLGAAVLGATACAVASSEAPAPQATEAREASDAEIAFVAGDSNIFATSAIGGSNRPITSGSGFDTQPDWSPDRERLAFVRSESPFDPGHIVLVNQDGTGLDRLTTREASFWDISWSPDGERLAATKSDVDGIRVYVMNADGSGLARLVEIQSSAPSWSPDGNFIAFDGNPRSREPDGIYRVDVRTGETTLLVHPRETLNQAPAWSPDGSRIAFIQIRVGTEGEQTITKGTELIVMDADGTNLRRLASDVSVSSPAWSPDSQQIVFASRGKLFKVDAQGGPTRPLGDLPVEGSYPDWA